MTEQARLKVTFAMIALAVLGVRFATSPWQFPDFDTYLFVSDALAFQPIRDTLAYEPLSSAFILSLRALAGNSFDGLVLAHWVLSLTFLVGFYKVLAEEDRDWKAALVTMGIYGSLLAFVTVRATPAYLLVWLSAIYASKGRLVCLPVALLAIGFHSSAALAVPPVLLCLLQQRSVRLGAFWRNNVLMGVSLGVVALLFSAFYLLLIDYLFLVLNIFAPFLGKYLVYMSAFEGNEGAQTTTQSILFHQAYLAAASLLTVLFLFVQNDEAKRLRSYVILSFAIFIFLSASPVSAYRQSIFWTVPAILYLPWKRLGFAGFGSVAVAAFGSVAFLLGVRSILI